MVDNSTHSRIVALVPTNVDDDLVVVATNNIVDIVDFEIDDVIMDDVPFPKDFAGIQARYDDRIARIDVVAY